MLKIYYADISSINTGKNYDNFSSYRLERLSRLKKAESRKQSIGAELLLLHAVKENSGKVSLPLSIIENSFGRPCCGELPFNFSISHSGKISAVAVSDGELGMDVQKLALINEALCLRRFTEAEREYISQSADKNIAFTEIWSMKESYLKAVGTGLRAPLSSFSVQPKGRVGRFSIKTTQIGDYIFSVCTDKIDEEPLIYRLML